MKQKSTLKKLLGSREFLLLVIVIAMFLIVSAINPAFFSFKAISDMMKNNAVTMVMALGMLCVMLVGGIDISCMSALALAAMSIGMLFKYGGLTSTILAFLIATAIGTACGFVVGLIISRADVPPIIATMGCTFPNFGTGSLLGLNNLVWVIIIAYVIFFIFMKWFRLGRKIYAVGSNPEAAQVSGINVRNIKLLVYTIMGVLSGLSGALYVATYASAQPNMNETTGAMDIIAACVIGGVSMSGGRGTVIGVLLGSFIMAMIPKALPLLHIDALWQNTIKGVLILVVVVVNAVLQRVADRNALSRREM